MPLKSDRHSMTKTGSIVAASLLLFASAQAWSQQFDGKLLSGSWSESTDTNPVCTSDNLRVRFEINPEGNTLTFFLDRKWRVVTGEDVDHFTANIVQSNSRAMIIQYNWDRSKTPKDYPLVWELVVIAPGLYRWRSPEWPEGQVNSVVGVRCEE
jgi:hypothetical protein